MQKLFRDCIDLVDGYLYDSDMSRDTKSTVASDIDKMDTMYDVGDFKRAREIAHEVLDTRGPEGIDRTRIDRVLTATKTDPIAIGALVFTVALLIHLFVLYAV